LSKSGKTLAAEKGQSELSYIEVKQKRIEDECAVAMKFITTIDTETIVKNIGKKTTTAKPEVS
jgi:hypothetical protein